MPRIYYLGGRTFSLTEGLTGRQDGWMIVQTQDIGLDAIINRRLRADGDKAAEGAADLEAARSFIVEAHRAGKYHSIIAGRVVEDGKKWTPKDAEANAEFFADLSEPADKMQLADLFATVLKDFFLSAASSLGLATASPPATGGNGARPRSSDKPSTPPPADTAGPIALESLRAATASE
jgi:hypothetical protein